MRPLRHKSLTRDKHPSTVSVSVSSETRPTEFEKKRDPAFPPTAPINVPSSYRFFNRAAYCRRCIPSERGIVRVSRERWRLIRHRKTRSFPQFSDFTLFPSRREMEFFGQIPFPVNSSILSR